jgi:hypothetical protein
MKNNITMREERLPLWVKEELASLRTENDNLRKQLNIQSDLGSPISWRVFATNTIPATQIPAHARVIFSIGGRDITLFVDSDGFLVIHGDDALNVLPRASNAITLEPRRFKPNGN